MELKNKIFKNLKVIELTKYNKLKLDIKTLKKENKDIKSNANAMQIYYGSELGLNDKIQQEQKEYERKIDNLNVERIKLINIIEENDDEYIELSEKYNKLKEKNGEVHKLLNKKD